VLPAAGVAAAGRLSCCPSDQRAGFDIPLDAALRDGRTFGIDGAGQRRIGAYADPTGADTWLRAAAGDETRFATRRPRGALLDRTARLFVQATGFAQRVRRVRNAAHVLAMVAGIVTIAAGRNCCSHIAWARSTLQGIAAHWWDSECDPSEEKHPKHHRKTLAQLHFAYLLYA
jgi:hypothetical protein